MRLPISRPMCGIAGYSLSSDTKLDRTVAARALLAGIAERGADAVGYAYRTTTPDVVLHKQQSGASALVDRILIPSDTSQLLLHVRDYTKGHPSLDANNHPIRHGSVVGVHNGACTARSGTADSPKVTFTLDLVPFTRLVTGQQDGMKLFMTGKLKLGGDMMFATRVNGFFEPPKAS